MVFKNINELRNRILAIQYEKTLFEAQMAADIGLCYRTYRAFMDKPEDANYQVSTFKKVKDYIQRNSPCMDNPTK